MNHLQVIPLHRHQEYTNDCVKLLNSEWPRSETARLRSLHGSCDTLPTNLIMVYILSAIDNNNDYDDDSNINAYHNNPCHSSNGHQIEESNEEKIKDHNLTSCGVVVGHSKISRLCSVENSCFIESVVIDKTYRGKGWGKYLMEQTELFAKQLGLNIVYLTTMDKQGFYQRIGYFKTDPVPIFGVLPMNIDASFKLLSISSSKSLHSTMSAKSLGNSNSALTEKRNLSGWESDVNIPERTVMESQLLPGNIFALTPPPPPPLPPPLPPPAPPTFFKTVGKNENDNSNNGCRGNHSNGSKKTYMMKFI